MTPLKIVETRPGNHSLLLNAGTTAVDGVVEEFGHEANGYFWEGIAQLLVATEAPDLDGRFKYDPEGGMFVAYGTDVAALEQLGTLLAVVANSPARLREIMAVAAERGFEFDD
ncbi:Imm51 family immunity protein [Dactylosporangium sp. NPDC051541]|uniref:Imm51 family immunity protein n=1 Tax=Dactylosporangium sp. NPDC051541 TaxID=3363977 RepID=UPI0037B8086C